MSEQGEKVTFHFMVALQCYQGEKKVNYFVIVNDLEDFLLKQPKHEKLLFNKPVHKNSFLSGKPIGLGPGMEGLAWQQ